MSIAWLNGKFLPLADTQVSVMDRGFLFGDGVYEVIPVYGGRLFRLAHHLKRLHNSLDAVRIANPLSTDAWETMLTELVSRNEGGDQAVYLQVTRGVAGKRDHAFPENITPTLFAMSTPMAASVDIDGVTGIAAITLPDIRWKLCNIKAITLLPNVMLRQQAIDGDCAEASDLILELAANHAIPFREAGITQEALFSADEIWLTSSTREISPVTRLDDTVISGGVPGPMWRRMISLYQEYKTAIRKGKAC
jgi:D-alanine transaminase